MKKILLLSCFLSILLSNAQEQETSNLIQCNAIFEAKKEEIINQIKELDNKKQSLAILQKASDALFNQRENKLKEQEQKLDNKLKEIQMQQDAIEQSQRQSEDRIKKMLQANEDLLKQIRDETENKIAQTYAKMKDSKAAAILSDLSATQAANILFLLKPQEIGKILAKMDPKKASILTQTLKKGPPFEENTQTALPQNTKEDVAPSPSDKEKSKPLI